MINELRLSVKLRADLVKLLHQLGLPHPLVGQILAIVGQGDPLVGVRLGTDQLEVRLALEPLVFRLFRLRRTLLLGEAALEVVNRDGVAGLLWRGLAAKILCNGLSSIFFSVAWKGLMDSNEAKAKAKK